MGLSILIPVFNVNVTSLVNALAGQLVKTGKAGEIILLDDGSDNNFVSANNSIQHPLVASHRNEKNEGRMISRRKLAGMARYQHLLFLDCDSGIIKDDFLNVYFDLIENNTQLASGGRIYDTQPPGCSHILHWKYGTRREGGNKGQAFMSNNFLVVKELFDKLDHAAELPGYGHEDSWWGIQFEQAGVHCIHVQNPVLHTAVETNEVFLDKSTTALNNLLTLEKKTGKQLLAKHVKIYRWYRRLKSSGLSVLYLFFEKPFHGYFKKNLLSCKPNLFFFDCYRLAVLLRMGRSAKQ